MSLRGHLVMCKGIFGLHSERGLCLWHLMGGSQGYCQTSYSAQSNSHPQQKMILPQIVVLRMRNSALEKLTYRHISLYCASFYSVSIYCFSQIEGLRQLCIKQMYQHHFPRAFAHFVCLCYVVVIFTMFQSFS